MEMKKILSLSEKIINLDGAVDLLASGDSVKIVLTNGENEYSFILSVSPDRQASYIAGKKIKDALEEFGINLQRDLLSLVRPA